MATESTFLLAGLVLVLAAAGWAMGRFGERDRLSHVHLEISDPRKKFELIVVFFFF